MFLLVAIDLFTAFVPLCASMDKVARAGVEPLDTNRFAGLLAITVSTVFDALKCCVDFRNQLALSVTRSKFDGSVVSEEARSARSG